MLTKSLVVGKEDKEHKSLTAGESVKKMFDIIGAEASAHSVDTVETQFEFWEAEALQGLLRSPLLTGLGAFTAVVL